MPLTLYSHPFSSYCQKVLIAFWENDVSFQYRHLEEPGASEELASLWPLRRFPVLVDDGLTVVESSIIIEHLDQHHPGPVRFIPNDPEAALEVRLMDRFFDNYSMSAMQKPVFEALSRRGARKEDAMSEARVALDTAYAWLERRLAGRAWAAGEDFTMADCAAAPSLFLRRLGSPDCANLPATSRVSRSVAEPPVFRTRRRRRASIPRILPVRSSRSGLGKPMN